MKSCRVLHTGLMIGVLVGFAIIASVILAGYIAARARVLGEQAGIVLSRLVFYVLAPCLLFTTLADADVKQLFSSLLLVALVSALVAGILFAVIARTILRRSVSETVIGSLASSYVNANNIGIPIALYVLGDAALSAPVILLQLLVFAPIALTILDIQDRGRVSVGRVLLQPLTNPIIVGSFLGVLLSVLQVTPPPEVMEPFRLIGAAAVPVVLIAFGVSLHGVRPLAAGPTRVDVLIASGIKAAVMPVVAWLLGSFVFGLSDDQLFAAVVLAALPTAQNVFTYAQRYDRGVLLARDAVLVTTFVAAPVLLLVAALLAPR